MAFDKNVFIKAFDAAIISLAGAEKITKAVLLDLSRSVLEAHHITEDVGYINRLIAVLTPVNKKVAVLYFKAFSGFKWSDEKQEFVSKNKKEYDACHKAAIDFLNDPLNNIWTWAAREIEIEAKEFDEARMKKQVEALLKKVNDNKLSQVVMLKAMLENGLSLDSIIALMKEVEGN
jgi:hypothetical protein